MPVVSKHASVPQERLLRASGVTAFHHKTLLSKRSSMPLQHVCVCLRCAHASSHGRAPAFTKLCLGQSKADLQLLCILLRHKENVLMTQNAALYATPGSDMACLLSRAKFMLQHHRHGCRTAQRCACCLWPRWHTALPKCFARCSHAHVCIELQTSPISLVSCRCWSNISDVAWHRNCLGLQCCTFGHPCFCRRAFGSYAAGAGAVLLV